MTFTDDLLVILVIFCELIYLMFVTTKLINVFVVTFYVFNSFILQKLICLMYTRWLNCSKYWCRNQSTQGFILKRVNSEVIQTYLCTVSIVFSMALETRAQSPVRMWASGWVVWILSPGITCSLQTCFQTLSLNQMYFICFSTLLASICIP